MEVIYHLATTCLLLFMVLATYDGFYLHLFKYGLFNRKESLFEHKTHTIRAILFPLIVWFLFIDRSNGSSLFLGLFLVFLDIIVLGIDAFSEKESRSFMGGLPKWEYVVHLFSNTFHFSAIVLVLAIRLTGSDTRVSSVAGDLFNLVSLNVIPGGILLAILHLLLIEKRTRSIWNYYRSKIVCC